MIILLPITFKETWESNLHFVFNIKKCKEQNNFITLIEKDHIAIIINDTILALFYKRLFPNNKIIFRQDCIFIITSYYNKDYTVEKHRNVTWSWDEGEGESWNWNWSCIYEYLLKSNYFINAIKTRSCEGTSYNIYDKKYEVNTIFLYRYNNHNSTINLGEECPYEEKPSPINFSRRPDTYIHEKDYSIMHIITIGSKQYRIIPKILYPLPAFFQKKYLHKHLKNNDVINLIEAYYRSFSSKYDFDIKYALEPPQNLSYISLHDTKNYALRQLL